MAMEAGYSMAASIERAYVERRLAVGGAVTAPRSPA